MQVMGGSRSVVEEETKYNILALFCTDKLARSSVSLRW